MKHAILIVEDNATKRVEIENALPRSLEYSVEWAQSIAQSYRALEGREWDLVILDMTFQVSQSFGKEIIKEPLAGIELLQYMSRRQIAAPVIVATQHSSFSSSDMSGIDTVDDLHELLLDLFPRNYRSIVRVDLSEETWKHDLAASVDEVLNVG